MTPEEIEFFEQRFDEIRLRFKVVDAKQGEWMAVFKMFLAHLAQVDPKFAELLAKLEAQEELARREAAGDHASGR